MSSLKLFLRRPWKSLIGLLLAFLASAVFCISLGQYIAARETEHEINRSYATIGYLTNAYMREDILGENGQILGVTWAPEQPYEIQLLLRGFEEAPPAFVQRVQQSLFASGCAPDLIPLHYDSAPSISRIIDDGGAHVSWDSDPYTCGMFVVRLDTVSPCFSPPAPETGARIEASATILEVVSFQEDAPDPTGWTIHLTFRFETSEAAQRQDLEAGQQYLVCGNDYFSNDAKLRRTLSSFLHIPTTEIDWSNIKRKGDFTPNRYDDTMVYMHPGGGRWTLSQEDLASIRSCSMTVCPDPRLWSPDIVGAPSISLSPSETISAEEYIARYQNSGFALLEGSWEDFLAATTDPFWSRWRSTAEVNNHTFPIVGTENLLAIPQFANVEATITAGRLLTLEDSSRNSRVCVISEALAVRNGLSLGSRISLGYFPEDREAEGNGFLPVLGNPLPAYYSATLGFETEPAEYEVVGIYRQSDQWSFTITSFTPNTIFVPLSTMPACSEARTGGMFTSVILEHGTTQELLDLAADQGFEKLFVCYDQGFQPIIQDLQAYFDVCPTVLRTGLALWLVILLLMVFLFPLSQRTELKRMWTLGTPPSIQRRHLFFSCMWAFLPGILLSAPLSYMLFQRITRQLASFAESGLVLAISVETIALIILAEVFLIILLSALLSWVLPLTCKKIPRGK